VAAYYGNRSFAYLKTECFGYALSDATKALELDKTYIKVGCLWYVFVINFMARLLIGLGGVTSENCIVAFVMTKKILYPVIEIIIKKFI